MAGHSKFKNIMHRKGAQDKRRAQLFAKLAKELTIAAKMGGPDPAMNPRLRLAIANAKAESLPKDNIQRAIDKAAGGGGDDYIEARYEGFGPGGIGVIVECSTDNRNRAAGDIRVAFNKNGGNMGETGSVSCTFDQVGEIEYPAAAASADAMMEAAIEAGAQDVESDADGHWVYTAREDLFAVVAALQAQCGEPSAAKIIWKPQNVIEVEGEQADQLMKLVSALDDLDDVQNVYYGFELSAAEMARLSE
jgi:YebC/PmpR family DNA-binding regulatory protein